jgi:hypothetical protein
MLLYQFKLKTCVRNIEEQVKEVPTSTISITNTISREIITWQNKHIDPFNHDL